MQRTDRIRPLRSENIGECYNVTGRAVVFEDAGTLVHGIIRNDIGDVGHSWVMRPDGHIYEPTTDSVYHRDDFDALYRPITLAEYEPDEARALVLSEGHWGPFDAASIEWAATYHEHGGDHREASWFATEQVTA